MGIAREIGQHRSRSGEGTFGEDDKVFSRGVTQEPGECDRSGVDSLSSTELHFAFPVELLESRPELAAEHGGECANGEQPMRWGAGPGSRSEEHTSELQ